MISICKHHLTQIISHSPGVALTKCEKNLKDGEPKGIVSQIWERMASLSQLQEYLATITPWTEVRRESPKGL